MMPRSRRACCEAGAAEDAVILAAHHLDGDALVEEHPPLPPPDSDPPSEPPPDSPVDIETSFPLIASLGEMQYYHFVALQWRVENLSQHLSDS